MDANQINKDYYNRNAEKWAVNKTDSFFHEQGFRKLLDHLKDDDSVIDIGCAYGIHVPLFLGIGRALKYEGFDISESMIKLAKSRYPQLNFFIADLLDKETLPNKKYNAFWAGAVLMHIPSEQWDNMFDNIETLAPSGFGYFSLPTVRPNESSDDDQRHFTLLSEEETIQYIRNRGWQLVGRGGFTSPNKAIWKWYLVKLP
jgi:trans-aconitate methyltransferase